MHVGDPTRGSSGRSATPASFAGSWGVASTLDQPSLSVLLVDDHALRRASLARFLESMAALSNIRLEIAEVSGPIDVRQATGSAQVAILATSSVECAVPTLAELQRLLPSVPVVMLADDDSPAEVTLAVRRGAQGYISMRSNPAIMLHALEFVAAGGYVFPPETLLAPGTSSAPNEERSEVAATIDDSSSIGRDGLTQRQQEVLSLLREGQSNKRIARALGLCEATVKVHVRQVIRRLGVTNRTQAALVAADKAEDAFPNELTAASAPMEAVRG